MAAFWILLGVFLGIAGKYVVDLKLANKNKLREEKLKWSVELLAAAGRVAQAVATWCSWQQELRHRVAVDPDSRTVEELGRLAKRPVGKRARVDPYKARGAVRLLTPDSACDASDYLELRVRDLDEGPDRGGNRAAKLEDARRKQLGA